jgi:transcriptional regulator with XRE-family HTH domain
LISLNIKIASFCQDFVGTAKRLCYKIKSLEREGIRVPQKTFCIRLKMAGRHGETLGQYLRRERESRSVSLQELSKNTRINVSFLEALEKDDFEAFPRQEFILGFLQGYARQLGLKGEEVLRRYRIQAEWAGRKEKFQQMPLFPGSVPSLEEKEAAPEWEQPFPLRGKKRIPWKMLIQTAIVLFALGFSFYLHQMLKNTGPQEKISNAGGGSPGKEK